MFAIGKVSFGTRKIQLYSRVVVMKAPQPTRQRYVGRSSPGVEELWNEGGVADEEVPRSMFRLGWMKRIREAADILRGE